MKNVSKKTLENIYSAAIKIMKYDIALYLPSMIVFLISVYLNYPVIMFISSVFIAVTGIILAVCFPVIVIVSFWRLVSYGFDVDDFIRK